MKLLVLAENYPSKDSHNRMYIHVRNKYYKKNNIDVTVISFKAKENYNYEGINVISYNSFKKMNKDYDLLICHAPNIKHHYFFIKKYNKYFKRIILFFHGQEILKLSIDYPKEYNFRKKPFFNKIFRDLYDELKFKLWNKELKKIINKIHLVFVSNYLFNKFKSYIKIDEKLIKNKYSIINNSVGELFENNNYNKIINKEYDFITIRGEALDESKYGIDIVTEIAKNNIDYKFLVIGNGKFYEYNKLPNNLTFINKILTHEDIIKYLNKSRYALMPTRHDTQGVLTSEMATFGIPVITSDLEVTKEMFNSFKNVVFINNTKINLDKIIKHLKFNSKKNEKFFYKNTVLKEIELFKELL